MIVNQKFIAKEAGVSQKTVSLYFQNNPLVAERTRRKLDEIVKKYHYLPNLAAMSIKSKKFNRIACIVVQQGDISDQCHPQLLAYINGASFELAQHGYSLVFEPIFVNKTNLEICFHEFFHTLSCDAVIGIQGGWFPPEIDERLSRLELPIVWLNRSMEAKDNSYGIRIDEEKTTALLAEYLLQVRAGQVAWYGPELHDVAVHHSSRERYDTLRKYLENHDGRLVVSEFSPFGDSLDKKALPLMKKAADFNVVVCYNFNYRLAVIQAAIQLGIDLRKFRIFHFASLWEHNYRFFKGMEYVLLPEYELGKNGARFLLSCLQGNIDENLLKPLVGTIVAGNRF